MFTKSKKRHRLRMVIPAYPSFNIYSSIAIKTTALGPVSVATVVREMDGWDVEVIDENNLRRYGPRARGGGADHEYLEKLRPADIVGLYGGLTSTVPRLYEVARFYKQRGVVTIGGGQHFVDENIAEALGAGIDYVVLGEGEETIKELIVTLQNNGDLRTVKGIAYRKGSQLIVTEPRGPVTDFDALPSPDFSLVRYAAIKLYPVGRIRGCGMDCEFCTVKGKPRCASPERMLEDIRRLVETHDARHFFVVDDLFGQYRNDTVHFCNMLKEYQHSIHKRLDLTVQIRLDKARDAELLMAMRQCGINAVAIGFESPIDEELQTMKKHIRAQEMIDLARLYHKFGFLVHGMFIFGYPLMARTAVNISSTERIKRYREFISKAKIDSIQILLPVPLPGTELRRRLKEENRIYSTEDIGWQYYDGNFPVFIPDAPLSPEEIQVSIRKIMGKFYQFKYMFLVGVYVIAFPTLIFYLHNIKSGWRRWYRYWRNSLLRFGGWIIIKGWTTEFKKGTFSQKLKVAQEHFKRSQKPQNTH